MAYNSYVILGEKIAVADSVDGGFVDEWLGNIEAVLDGRTPDYLVVHHMEPDHSAGIAAENNTHIVSVAAIHVEPCALIRYSPLKRFSPVAASREKSHCK